MRDNKANFNNCYNDVFTNNENQDKVKTSIAGTEKQSAGYGYYSHILKQPFNSLEELRKAEQEAARAQAEKELAKTERKEAAKKVEDAFKAYNEAKKSYNDKVRDAEKQYLKKQAALRDEYKNTVAGYQKQVREAESAYTKLLSNFTAQFGSFHTVLEDGDHVITVDVNSQSGLLDGMLDLFSTIFDKFPW